MSRNPQLQMRFRCGSGRVAAVLALVLCLCWTSPGRAQSSNRPATTNANRARVIIAEDPDVTYDLQPVPERVEAMVAMAMTNLTGKSTQTQAWLSLVSTTDIVAIKVFSAPGPNSGTRPSVVAAVVKGLLEAGLPPKQLIVWDKRAIDLRMAGFVDFHSRYGIRIMSSVEAGYEATNYYEAAFLGPMVYTDLEFNNQATSAGRKSHVSKLLSEQVTKIINITPLIHHNVVGVCGNLYSLAFGSVDNTTRFESNAGELSRAVPEIYALPQVGDRVVLNIVDALICQYEGQQYSLLHYSTVLNQLRFSRDPVALDVLSLQEINHQRLIAGTAIKTNVDLFSNASLVEIGVSDPKRIDVTRLSPAANPPARLP